MTSEEMAQGVFASIVEAVERVSELPGPMPEGLWGVLRMAFEDGNRLLIEESYRIAVRSAKRQALENLGFVRDNENRWVVPDVPEESLP